MTEQTSNLTPEDEEYLRKMRAACPKAEILIYDLHQRVEIHPGVDYIDKGEDSLIWFAATQKAVIRGKIYSNLVVNADNSLHIPIWWGC